MERFQTFTVLDNQEFLLREAFLNHWRIATRLVQLLQPSMLCFLIEITLHAIRKF